MPLISSFGIPRLFRRRKSRTGVMIILVCIAVLLLSPFYFIYYPPAVLFRYLHHRFPEVLFYALPAKGEKIVALTIDDAPSSITPDLLQILGRYNAHATFFILGERDDDGVLREIVKAKSELGNHGMRDTPAVSIGGVQLKTEIDAVWERIEGVYSSLKLIKPPRYYRPGSGWFNRSLLAIAKAAGHRVVLGNVYPYDAQVGYSWLNTRHILSMVRPGSIIICHDGRPWTPKTLDAVLKELKKRGYAVVTITELLASSKKNAG